MTTKELLEVALSLIDEARITQSNAQKAIAELGEQSGLHRTGLLSKRYSLHDKTYVLAYHPGSKRRWSLEEEKMEIVG